MKNVHVIPTEKPSRLFYNVGGGLLFTSYENANGVNVYITSNEDIKDGDWILEISDNSIFTIQIQPNTNLSKYKKVILTTDQDLIADGVQAIDGEFLEWFVKNPSCESVEVESMINMIQFTPREFIYKIIIPQEEPEKEYWKPKVGEKVRIKVFSNWSMGRYIGYDYDREVHLVREPEEGGGHLLSSKHILPYSDTSNESKQETLEEAAKKYKDLKLPDDLYDGFIVGAKWKEEQIPSIIEQKWLEYRDNTNNEDAWCFKEWLVEQFKKK